MNKNLSRIAMATSVLGLSAAACLSSSSGGPGNGSSSSSGGGSGSGSGSSSGSSSGGSGGSSGGTGSSSGSSGGDGGGCMTVPLTPDPTGYVSTTSVGIVGAWFAYGDNLGMNGAPPGNCVTKGMHTTAQCSDITSPPPAPADGGTATFPQTTAGTMCLSGTAAQVIGTPPDYSNIFGIGIGLDFNNPSGTVGQYDAMMNHVTGFQFTVAGLPAGTVRVEFQEPATDTSGDAWSYTVTANGQVTVNLKSGTGTGDLSPAFTPTGMQPAFDPTKLEAIQFHVVTNKNASIMVTNFCISGLSAIVCM